MLPRTIQRVCVAVILVGGALVLPPERAIAYTDLPFEFRFPQEAVETQFSSSFGDSRPGGRSHNGVDLMAPRMTEVYAFADGVVTRITTHPLAGRYLVITHDEVWETYYVHLNDHTPGTTDASAPWSYTIAPGIEEGAEVTAGQLIGWVGDSGNARGAPHTHFELRRNGRPIDPYPYLVQAWEQDLLESLQQIIEILESAPYKID